MVIGASNRVKLVNDICLRDTGAVSTVRSVVWVAVGRLVLPLDRIERSVRHVARESLG